MVLVSFFFPYVLLSATLGSHRDCTFRSEDSEYLWAHKTHVESGIKSLYRQVPPINQTTILTVRGVEKTSEPFVQSLSHQVLLLALLHKPP